MENQIVKQVIATIRTDMLKNQDFLKEILSGVKLNQDNIPKETILFMMNELGASMLIKRPVSNAPKTTSDGKDAVAKPVPLAANSINAQIVSDLLEGNNVYLMGKAGTGKTYTAKGIAESIMGQPTYVINCSQWTSPVEIRGGQTIKGYQEGQLIEAWANGGVLILDELPKLDPNTAGLLNDALAETSSQPKYDKSGNVIEKTIPYIVNGRGDKIYKGQDVNEKILGERYDKMKSEDKSNNITKKDYIKEQMELKFRFCVIGTGNTDMMNVGNKYAGNQKQDYSLVDRFAGSFYTLEQNTTTERALCYDKVFDICDAIRWFLIAKDAVQSISLRTMLNFNRTFEQEMLYKMESPYADKLYDNVGQTIEPKTLDNSIDSFKTMLDAKMVDELELDVKFKEAISKPYTEDDFIMEFKVKYHHDPKTGDPLSQEELDMLFKDTKDKKDN